MKPSTGLLNGLLVTGALRALLGGGKLRIFGGSVPADADAAETGTLLCVITNNDTGTGLTFETTASAGTLSKTSSELWRGTVGTGGLATYFRFVGASDTGAASTTDIRLQGNVGVAGADMNLSNPTLVAASVQTIQSFIAYLS